MIKVSPFFLTPVVPSDRRLISIEADGALLTFPPFVSVPFNRTLELQLHKLKEGVKTRRH